MEEETVKNVAGCVTLVVTLDKYVDACIEMQVVPEITFRKVGE